MGSMTERGPRWLGALVVAVTLLLSIGVRQQYDVSRSTAAGGDAWVSLDADSLYHMRRVQRVRTEGWPVAGSDPWLDHPDGAEIPWPPYYSALLAGLAAVLIDGGPGETLAVEQLVASVPLVFGVLTALLAALVARRLAGNAAGAFAGVTAALALGAVVYSALGNGDHHAFVAFLHAVLLAGLSSLLARGVLEEGRGAAKWGVALGALIGVALGSWVAFLTYVVEVELVLALLLFRHARAALPGLARFGLALHAAALVVLLPAVLDSPWLGVEPWSVVNLSWFHPFFLLVGAVVFVPIAVPALAERVRPRYPWLVAAGLVVLFGGLLLFDAGPSAALREAVSWLSREDRFMASIIESRSLFDDPAAGIEQLEIALGWGIYLVPLAWIAGVVACVRGERALLPWLVAVPLLALQAVSQLRFAEGFVVPLAVVLGWAFGALVERFAAGRTWPRLVGALVGIGFALLLQQPGLGEVRRYTGAAQARAEPLELQQQFGAMRRACAWLRDRVIEPEAFTVLSSWGNGHVIEWVAERPTVATNFGSYLGEDSYTFGPRAFLAEEPATLEALLVEREVGYVLLGSRITEMLPDLVNRAEADPERYLVQKGTQWRGGLRPAWFRTQLARLLVAGGESSPDLPAQARRAPGFLRLVHVSPELDPRPVLEGVIVQQPRACVWQRVEGATLRLRGTPGESFALRLEVEYPASTVRLEFERSGTLGPEGTRDVRVPYATDAPNGDGRVLPGAELRVGDARIALSVPEAAVREGLTIELPLD